MLLLKDQDSVPTSIYMNGTGLFLFSCVALSIMSFAIFQVEQSKVLIKEGGVQLTLTIVDTPGFGDAVDNSNW